MVASRSDDLACFASDWRWLTDSTFRLVAVEGRFEEHTGVPAADRIGTPWPGTTAPSVQNVVNAARVLHDRRAFRDVLVDHAHPDGRTRWFRLSGSPIFEADGSIRGFRGIAVDVTTERDGEAERSARLSRLEEDMAVQIGRFETALQHMSHGLVLFDAQHRVVMFNDTFVELYGLPKSSVRPGMSAEELVRERAAAGSFPGRSADEAWSQTRKRLASPTNYRLDQQQADGRTVGVSFAPTPDGGFITVHEDITAQKRAEAHIAHLARHDALTGLPNRRTLEEHLGMALGTHDETAILCLDLDRFKTVNDTLGHALGDTLLRQVTDRLHARIGDRTNAEGSLVARLGGDEFAVVLPRSNATDAMRIATDLIEAIDQGYEVGGHHANVGLSIGIALAPTNGTSAEQLMRAADMALYKAKSEGRGTFRFFEPEMNVAMQARRALELDLRRALADDQFELLYQPILHLAANRICGFEALLRWRHPTRGTVSPLDFIPVTEETGLIVPLGGWVLREACREAARWPSPVGVSVNLSPVQFRRSALVLTVATALGEAGLHPGRLTLEITEGVLLQKAPTTLAMLRQWKDLGVRIALDDFGTGYSSLSYLRSFPFDTIKIDRSFVADIPASREATAIVKAVTGLGASLGMSTTAEGVETAEQMERLRAEGCTEAQGYLISRPIPSHEVRAMLDEDARTHAA